MTTIINNRQKQEIARIMGVENPDEINVQNPNWSQMLKQGVTAKVHISRWRATTPLTHEFLGLYDLDSDSRKAEEELVKLGHIPLLPNSYPEDIGRRLQSVETRSRQLIARFGIPTYWGNLILASQYQEFRDQADAVRNEYYNLRDELYDNWKAIIDEVIDRTANHARLVYRRVQRLTPEQTDRYDFENEDRFVDLTVRRVRQLIPDRDEVYLSFDWTLDLNYIPLPDMMAQAVADASETLNEAYVPYRVRRYADEIAEANARIKTTQAEMLERQLREMNRDVVENTRAQAQDLMDGFFRDVILYSRNLVENVYTNAISRTTKTGKLHSRVVVQLRNMVEEVQKVAQFNGDVDLEELIAPAKSILETAPGERDADTLVLAMVEARNQVREQLIALQNQPRRTRRTRNANDLQVEARNERRQGRRERESISEISTRNERRQGRRQQEG